METRQPIISDEPQLKTAYVRNIGNDISREELIDLFALNKTPFLETHSRVSMIHGSDQNSAIIEVPEKVHDEMLKLNGMTYKGHHVIISANPDPSNKGSAESTGEGTEDERDEQPDVEYLEIDTRLPEWLYNQVTDMEIARALDVEFNDDPTKSVEDIGRYRSSQKGIFRIDSADYSRYEGRSLPIRGKDLPFQPRFRRPANTNFRRHNDDRRSNDGRSDRRQRKDGTLITIYQAYRLENRHLANELFDDHFVNLGIEIVKTTLPQFRKGTTVLNNNRYLVVQKLDDNPELRNKIGSSIVIGGRKFNMVYTGLEKWCYECRKVHGYCCPKRARNEFLQKLRQDKTSKRKLYSDSIAQHANVPALTTDIACMSGGGIGQLINAIPLDEKHDEVVLIGGTNEVAYTKNANEYVFTIEKSLQKLSKLAEVVPTTFVLPCVPLTTPDMKAKADFLEESVRKIPTVKVLKLENIEHEDDSIHPSEPGTVAMVKQLDSFFNGEIVLEGVEDSELTTRRYGKVETLYKVGCRGCDNLDYTPFLCTDCRETAENTCTDRLMQLTKAAEDEMFPQMEVETTKDKRPLSDNEDDRQSKLQRDA